MNRYLLNIAYIGTKFRGVTKNQAKNDLSAVNDTIEGNIQAALEKLKPVNPVQVHVSSRTDSGVHALHSTVHVDLKRNSGTPYHPVFITHRLNQLFHRWSLELHVLSTERVPDTFIARRAVNRSYLYRFAVAKEQHDAKQSYNIALGSRFIPIEEHKRCYFILNRNFDINRAKEAAKLLLGKHDFRTFMCTSKEQKTLHPLYAVRTMNSITIQPGASLATPINEEKVNNLYDFWDIEFNAQSYIYRQIRKMTGTLIAAGEGKITQRDIYQMLTVPSKHSWIPGIPIAPPEGLYLSRIEYDERAKKMPEVDESRQELIN